MSGFITMFLDFENSKKWIEINHLNLPSFFFTKSRILDFFFFYIFGNYSGPNWHRETYKTFFELFWCVFFTILSGIIRKVMVLAEYWKTSVYFFLVHTLVGILQDISFFIVLIFIESKLKSWELRKFGHIVYSLLALPPSFYFLFFLLTWISHLFYLPIFRHKI